MFHISHNKYLLGDFKAWLVSRPSTLRKKPCFFFSKSLKDTAWDSLCLGWREKMKAISQCDLLLLYYEMFQYTAVYVMTFSILHRVPGVPDPYSLTDPLFNVYTACLSLLVCWECSRENTSGFLPFVFASDITQFTYKYGLSCPFSMPEPQTNLPLALIWKMSLLSQGNRIILIDGKRQNHICLDKKRLSYEKMAAWIQFGQNETRAELLL